MNDKWANGAPRHKPGECRFCDKRRNHDNYTAIGTMKGTMRFGRNKYEVIVVSDDRVRTIVTQADSRQRAITGAIRHAENSEPDREYVLLQVRQIGTRQTQQRDN